MIKNKKLTSNEVKVNSTFIVRTLRNCGYTNYSAIADIVDNSLEDTVGSKKISIDFETEGKGSNKEITSIFIIDDGCGMTKEVLEEAMALGSETGKNGEENLGMYGVGLKTASLSIGQCLEVYTKTEGGILYHSIFDVEDGEIQIGVFEADITDITFFEEKVKGDSGTIIKISKLDKLTNKDYYSFKQTLKRKMGEIFNKFIDAKYCDIFVSGDKVEMIDLVGNKVGIPVELLSGNNSSFTVDGKEVRYNAWFIPKMGGDSIEGDNYLVRGSTTSGLYIYRQNRLVGQALNLSILSKDKQHKDSWLNGLRFEIFIDGTFDNLFGSSFTKMIAEKDKESINKSLIDKMYAELRPFVLSTVSREKHRTANDRDKKQDEVFYKKVQKKQDEVGPLLGVPKKGLNKPSNEPKKDKNPNPKPQLNPNPTRLRKDTWCEFEERALGMTEVMYTSEIKNGKALIIINSDHAFYKKFYCELDNEHKFVMAQLFSCDYVAKKNCNYYNDEDTQKIIDNYLVLISESMRKSLDF